MNSNIFSDVYGEFISDKNGINSGLEKMNSINH